MIIGVTVINRKLNKISIQKMLALGFLLCTITLLGIVSETSALNVANLRNLSPANESIISSVQPFRGVLDNWSVSNYTMYWTVDTSTPILMPTNYVGLPHKEVAVDVSSWNWNSDGRYMVTYIARNLKGNEIARKSFTVNVSSITGVSSKPLVNEVLYRAPDSSAAMQANVWRADRPMDAGQMDKLASLPASKWFGGWNNDVQSDSQSYTLTAAKAGALPVLVAYNIPQRDCGGYSAGGVPADIYIAWIKQLATGIGTNKAVVILEPDALANLDCLTTQNQTTRLNLMSQAVDILKANSATYVYLDGGNPRWISADIMAARLSSANIVKANGFSLNVSNFISTSENTTYGNDLSAKLYNKHYIIDTSRNGSGPTSNSEWCNPAGRSLGPKPSTRVDDPLIDAYLWIKVPGESDGTCNGGPVSGGWWADYALGLSERAAY